MRAGEIPEGVTLVAFEFFYCFSRFEFALKKNNYLKSHEPGSIAEPSWQEFVKKWLEHFEATENTDSLLRFMPKRQVVLEHDSLAWRSLDFSRCNSNLEMVILCLKTVRNNLFHGGKSSVDGWDDPQRTEALLKTALTVLEQLARLGGFEADYSRRY